jgi:hypothetical protein
MHLIDTALDSASSSAADNGFAHASTYVLFAAFVSLALGSIHLLNRALRVGDALFVIPIYSAFSLVLTIGVGMVFFQTIYQFSGYAPYAFVCGVAMNMYGVWLASRHRSSSSSASATAPPPALAMESSLSDTVLDRPARTTYEPDPPHPQYGSINSQL